MSEPQATVVQGGASLVGGLIVLAGPQLGPWLAVLAASFVGSLWTLGGSETQSRLHAALLLLRVNLTALVLTGCVSVPVVSYNLLPHEYALPAIAFALGAIGTHYKGLIEWAIGAAKNWVGGGQ